MLECFFSVSSNNTNKLSPQEPSRYLLIEVTGSNNTNKLSPQERTCWSIFTSSVQIIQINLVLKNLILNKSLDVAVQIIQINLVLKNVVDKIL